MTTAGSWKGSSTGIGPWRDLPREEFGAWRTVWKRHRRYAADGTWDRVLAKILSEADAAREGRLGCLGGRHDCQGTPARDEHDATRAGHGGLGRTTTIRCPLTVNR